MKISIKMEWDSDNSSDYDDAYEVVLVSNEKAEAVRISFSNNSREVEVNKAELLKAIKILCG